jgi:NADH dehydrogenase
MPPTDRVVIVGGGFAGLFAARALRRARVQVTMLDRAGHHLFQPLLYQCATGIFSEGQIAAPLRKLLKRLHNAEFELDEAVDIDSDRRHVIARHSCGESFELPYDDLIIAAGMRASYFGHDEYARWAPGMKTFQDALATRGRVFGAFKMAETASVYRDQKCRFACVVGVGRGRWRLSGGHVGDQFFDARSPGTG